MQKLEITPAARPELFHYSRNIVKEVESRDVADHEEGWRTDKPNGFWVSIDEPDEDGESYGWPVWCEAESFALDRLAVRHRVDILDTERLLWITTESDLIWFDKTFGRKGKYDREINWPLVADQFAGIVIAPYQWSQRFDLHWYYGWDCASGAIWDASVVQKITVLQRQETKT